MSTQLIVEKEYAVDTTTGINEWMDDVIARMNKYQYYYLKKKRVFKSKIFTTAYDAF
uniref:DHC_N2 domain-containing protein n=1 Tax=Heterorhabditis bacteriophora TaxID=37862 RepID=A0A1I7WWS1_HETBA